MRIHLSHQPPAPVTAGVLAVLVALGLAGLYWWLYFLGIHGTDQLWFHVPLALFLAIVMPYRMRRYADRVEDLGEGLHVVHGRREFDLPLAQIRRVSLSSLTKGRYLVKLKLVPSSEFGSAVRFYGALPSDRPTIQTDLESLRSRVASQWG